MVDHILRPHIALQSSDIQTTSNYNIAKRRLSYLILEFTSMTYDEDYPGLL